MFVPNKEYMGNFSSSGSNQIEFRMCFAYNIVHSFWKFQGDHTTFKDFRNDFIKQLFSSDSFFLLIVSRRSEDFQSFWKRFSKELKLFCLFPIKDIWATFFLVDQIKSNLECVLPTISYIHSESFKKIIPLSKISEIIS